MKTGNQPRVLRRRLEKSLSTLLGSNSNISTIAYEYGFNVTSYYCETFRKYYGMPPLIYKKNRMEGNKES